jgi:hypothetical protein
MIIRLTTFLIKGLMISDAGAVRPRGLARALNGRVDHAMFHSTKPNP